MMNTHKIYIELPSDILLAINESENQLKKRIKLSLAIRLYKLKKVTIGKGAQIAGISKFEFETILSENKISISNLDIDDILNDIDNFQI